MKYIPGFNSEYVLKKTKKKKPTVIYSAGWKSGNSSNLEFVGKF